MTEIGYQNGIVAGVNGLRDLDPSKTLLKKSGGKWPSIDTLAGIPLDQWKAWDKMERAFTILVHDHDAAQSGGGTPDPPVPPDPPSGKRYAPRTHNTVGAADARFCMKPEYGVKRVTEGDGYWIDEMGVRYGENGLDLGGRSKNQVPGLKGANSMDGLEPCDPYTNEGVTYPPYPPGSYEK